MFHKETNSLTADASELRPHLAHMTQQVWEDKPNTGFVMRSHKTGVEKVFLFEDATRDEEDDVLYWTFHEFLTPRAPAPRLHVKIYND